MQCIQSWQRMWPLLEVTALRKIVVGHVLFATKLLHFKYKEKTAQTRLLTTVLNSATKLFPVVPMNRWVEGTPGTLNRAVAIDVTFCWDCRPAQDSPRGWKSVHQWLLFFCSDAKNSASFNLPKRPQQRLIWLLSIETLVPSANQCLLQKTIVWNKAETTSAAAASLCVLTSLSALKVRMKHKYSSRPTKWPGQRSCVVAETCQFANWTVTYASPYSIYSFIKFSSCGSDQNRKTFCRAISVQLMVGDKRSFRITSRLYIGVLIIWSPVCCNKTLPFLKCKPLCFMLRYHTTKELQCMVCPLTPSKHWKISQLKLEQIGNDGIGSAVNTVQSVQSAHPPQSSGTWWMLTKENMQLQTLMP